MDCTKLMDCMDYNHWWRFYEQANREKYQKIEKNRGELQISRGAECKELLFSNFGRFFHLARDHPS